MVSPRQISSLHTLLGLVDVLLSDVSISVVGPNGVGPQFSALTIAPRSEGNIGNSPALVVLRNFHSSPVSEIGLRLKLELQSLVVLHFIEGPSRTDGQNVLSRLLALLLIVVVGDQAGLVGINRASAVLGEKLKPEGRVNRQNSGAFRLLEPGIGERVVVAGEYVVDDDLGGIGLNRSFYTSAFHHLSPNLASTATLSVVGTCCAAKGLMGAMARLNAAESTNYY